MRSIVAIGRSASQGDFGVIAADVGRVGLRVDVDDEGAAGRAAGGAFEALAA